MDVRVFLSRLGHVRKSGKVWMAKCPAHEDRSPSLMISERQDGSVGIHCFAGCQTEDVVGALALTMQDLFADSPHESGYKPPPRQWMSHADALKGLSQELGYAALIAIAIADLDPLDEPTLQRGLLAVGRIRAAMEFVEHGQ
jgi:hypothetical protein